MTTSEEWDDVGSDWKTTSSKISTVYPALKKIIGDFNGKKILDAGCGDGYGVVWCRKNGADCTGIDVSRESIKSCRLNDPEGQYFVDDVKNLKLDRSFDYILSVLVLLSLHSKKEISDAIISMRSKLKEDGKVIIVTPHPAFDCVNENMETMTVKSDGEYIYSSKGLPMIYTHKTKGFSLRDYHWMIEDYVECIKKAGLVVENILEPMPVPDLKR